MCVQPSSAHSLTASRCCCCPSCCCPGSSFASNDNEPALTRRMRQAATDAVQAAASEQPLASLHPLTLRSFYKVRVCGVQWPRALLGVRACQRLHALLRVCRCPPEACTSIACVCVRCALNARGLKTHWRQSEAPCSCCRHEQPAPASATECTCAGALRATLPNAAPHDGFLLRRAAGRGHHQPDDGDAGRGHVRARWPAAGQQRRRRR